MCNITFPYITISKQEENICHCALKKNYQNNLVNTIPIHLCLILELFEFSTFSIGNWISIPLFKPFGHLEMMEYLMCVSNKSLDTIFRSLHCTHHYTGQGGHQGDTGTQLCHDAIANMGHLYFRVRRRKHFE